MVKEWSLAPAVVQSRKAKQAYQRYLATDKIFRDEIAHKIGNIDDLPGFEGEMQVDDESPDYDDTGVPLGEVIRDALGGPFGDADDLHVAVQSTSSHSDTDSNTASYVADVGGVVADDHGGCLRPAADVENVWAYSDSGEPWNVNTINAA